MKIVVRVRPEQRKDDSEPAFGGRKAPDEGVQGAVAQRRLLVTVDVLGDEAAAPAEDHAVRGEDVRLRNLAKESTRRFEHQRTARGRDVSTVGAPDDERGKLQPPWRRVLRDAPYLRIESTQAACRRPRPHKRHFKSMPCSKKPQDTPADRSPTKASDELSPPLCRDAHARNAARWSGARPLPVSRRSKLTAPDFDRRARTPCADATTKLKAIILDSARHQQTIETSMERQPPV